MSLNEWSESIVLAETGEEPTFSEDMTSLMAIVEDSEQGGRDMPDMVVNLADVDYLNSSNIAQLLRLRKRLAASSVPVGSAGWTIASLTLRVAARRSRSPRRRGTRTACRVRSRG